MVRYWLGMLGYAQNLEKDKKMNIQTVATNLRATIAGIK
jgi:hypothetical protein